MARRAILVRLEEEVIALVEQERVRRGERSLNSLVASLIREACGRPSVKDLARAEVAQKLKPARSSRPQSAQQSIDPPKGDPGSTPGGQITPSHWTGTRCSRHKRLDCKEPQCAS